MRRLLTISTLTIFALTGCSGSPEATPIELSGSTNVAVAPPPGTPTTASSNQVDIPAYTPPSGEVVDQDAQVDATGPDCTEHLAPVREVIRKIRAGAKVSDEENTDMNDRLATVMDHCSNDEYMKFYEEMFPAS